MGLGVRILSSFKRNCQQRNGLIPAYAGSTASAFAGSKVEGAHPRLRGEHLGSLNCTATTPGSSPLTRGAHLLSRNDTSLKVILHTASSKRSESYLMEDANFFLSVGCTFCGLGVLSTNPSDASSALVYEGASLTRHHRNRWVPSDAGEFETPCLVH